MTYTVSVPVSGLADIVVEAETKEAAMNAAMEIIEKADESDPIWDELWGLAPAKRLYDESGNLLEVISVI